MRISRLIVSTIIFTLYCTASYAQWLSQEIEDPFGSDNIVGALTANAGKGLIVRCVGESRLELMFMPNEQGDESVASMANTLGLQILLRIDKDPIDTLDAVTHSNNDKIVAVASIDLSLAQRMAAAKQRIAAVAEMAEQKIGSVSFGISGSGKHIGKVIEACKETQAQAKE